MNSFTGNTKVLLPGSKTITISKVKSGQKVLATDPWTGKTAARPVAEIIRHHGVHAMVLISLLGGGVIHATEEPLSFLGMRAILKKCSPWPVDMWKESSPAPAAREFNIRDQ